MDKQNKIILVTGATGRQGGSVAQRLLSRGWTLRALARDPNKPASQDLAQKGVELIQGDLDNRDSLDRAVDGVYGVYSVQNSWECGVDKEIEQGMSIADAAHEAGVGHFIYSSVGGAERNTKIPHFESKWQIEQHIRALNLPCTILRPVFFMENFNSPEMRSSIMDKDLLSLPIKPDTPLQMIAVEDIGAFAALAFENPVDYLGKAIELAGDELTMLQTVDILSRVLARPVRFEETPMEQARQQSEDAAIMFDWFNREGYQADIPSLRQIYPQMKTLSTWVRQNIGVEAEARSASRSSEEQR